MCRLNPQMVRQMISVRPRWPPVFLNERNGRTQGRDALAEPKLGDERHPHTNLDRVGQYFCHLKAQTSRGETLYVPLPDSGVSRRPLLSNLMLLRVKGLSDDGLSSCEEQSDKIDW